MKKQILQITFYKTNFGHITLHFRNINYKSYLLCREFFIIIDRLKLLWSFVSIHFLQVQNKLWIKQRPFSFLFFLMHKKFNGSNLKPSTFFQGSIFWDIFIQFPRDLVVHLHAAAIKDAKFVHVRESIPRINNILCVWE